MRSQERCPLPTRAGTRQHTRGLRGPEGRRLGREIDDIVSQLPGEYSDLLQTSPVQH
jgi:hypothetical protein